MIARIRQSELARHGAIVFAGVLLANILNYLYYMLVGRAGGVETYGVVTSLTSALLVLSAPAIVVQLIVARLAADLEARAEIWPRCAGWATWRHGGPDRSPRCSSSWHSFFASNSALFFNLASSGPVRHLSALLCISHDRIYTARRVSRLAPVRRSLRIGRNRRCAQGCGGRTSRCGAGSERGTHRPLRQSSRSFCLFARCLPRALRHGTRAACTQSCARHSRDFACRARTVDVHRAHVLRRTADQARLRCALGRAFMRQPLWSAVPCWPQSHSYRRS